MMPMVLIRFGRWISGCFSAAWKWLKQNPIAMAGMVGAIIGAWFVWKSNKNKLKSLEDAIEVQANKRKIAAKETEARMLEERADEHEPRIKELKAEIAASKRRVVELAEEKDLKEMSDDEVADLFSRSGI